MEIANFRKYLWIMEQNLLTHITTDSTKFVQSHINELRKRIKKVSNEKAFPHKNSQKTYTDKSVLVASKLINE